MTKRPETVGYAVVGLGWISQAAVLPGFANARRNSRLVALVSGDEAKRAALADRYDLLRDATYDYDAFEACLDRDDVDAVYLAVPNHLHREYTVRAAERGIHVLCEKPMAVAPEECDAMIEACRRGGARLMVAYRMHFEPSNLHAVDLVKRGRIGDPRLFSATFTQQVDADDIRVMPPERGGGPLYDIGIYCLNAARYLFRAEPVGGRAVAVARDQKRFAESPEAIACTLRFPGERLASFTCSFGAHGVSVCHLVGDDGEIRIDNAFTFRGARTLRLTTAEGEESREFEEVDQFGSQLLYFSDCLLEGRDPEPDGEEGRIDVAIVRALHEALESGDEVDFDLARHRRPEPEQAMACPAVEPPDMVGASPP